MSEAGWAGIVTAKSPSCGRTTGHTARSGKTPGRVSGGATMPRISSQDADDAHHME
jgi:hypothetical protein